MLPIIGRSRGAETLFDDISPHQASFTVRRRSEFPITVTELSAIAAPAMIGLSRMPNTGQSTLAAIGTASALSRPAPFR